jgi:hypothetical protein
MRRPSFPTVISLIALFVALGGTSYAVTKLPANSVGNRELKPNAVSSGKIRNGAITSRDLAPSARGQRGPRGPQGSAGPSGGTGSSSAVEGWTSMPLAAGWTNYGGSFFRAAYRKDPFGRVDLRGLVKKDGVPAKGDVIATLPPGYRPTGHALFAVAAGGPGNIYGRLDVLPNGTIEFEQGSTVDGDFSSLDSVSFWTD